MTFRQQLEEFLGRKPTDEEVIIAFDFGTNGVLSGKTLAQLSEEADGE
jgi:hypothetical protein